MHYRQYKLKSPDGGIVRAKDVEARNDAEAMTTAAEDEDCPICELWQGKRKVGSIDHPQD